MSGLRLIVRLGARAAGSAEALRRTPCSVVQRAPTATVDADGQATSIEDVGVYHRRFHVFVAEEFLDCSDIVAVFQQVGFAVSSAERWRRSGGRCGK